jgi:hypothetical protein
MSAVRSTKGEELLKEGWTKQFCASGSRIQEAAELYESMGLEVHLEPLREEDLGCSECLQGPFGAFGDCAVIYTRPKGKTEDNKSQDTKRQNDDLW